MPKITVIPREIKENGYEQEPMGSVLCKILGVVGGGGVNKVHLFMFSMKMVNGKTGKYLSDIQLNLSTMAT